MQLVTEIERIHEFIPNQQIYVKTRAHTIQTQKFTHTMHLKWLETQ